MVTCREMRRGDLAEMTRVRNSVFTKHPIREEDWNEDETAVVAFDDGRMVGAIPLDMREFSITPKVSIRTAFENSVGVVAERRGQGIGTAMIECAATFLKPRCHALFVYRGEETSKAYHFYRKTGHHDLHFTRNFVLEDCPSLARPMMKIEEAGKALELELDLLRMFQDSYGNMAGFRKHEPGYYLLALDSHIFQEMNYELVKLGSIAQGGRIAAYALFAAWKNEVIVLEMASARSSRGAIVQLLGELAHFAHARHAKLSIPTSDTTPFLPVLRKLGFRGTLRGRIILARILRHKDMFDLLYQPRRPLEGITLRIWTPTFSFTALDGKGEEVVLEMKEDTLTRLLLARLNFAAAVSDEWITVRGGNERIIRALARAFPFCPWIYHHLDDI